MKTTTRILIPLTLLALSSSLAARPLDQVENRQDRRGKIQEVSRELGLSDAQRQQIKAIVLSYRDDIRQQITSGRVARKGMEEAVRQHGPESGEAREAASYLGEVAGSRALLLGEILTDVSTVLTDEQRKSFKELRGRMQGWIEEAISDRGL
jgi:Spy/CpxP family protein refolding chaperone